MTSFSLEFDSKSFDDLDQFALLARQDYNLGRKGDWFGEFRGGLYAFYARLHGIQVHYSEVHAWLPRLRLPTETEYQLASILFHMDSAFECLTFALNAFGWAVDPAGFRDVTDGSALRRVSPVDVFGDPNRTPPLTPQPGFLRIFPRFQAVWQGATGEIHRIRDLHDVSKHRRTLFVGGRIRSDPPDGFYDGLGIGDDAAQRAVLAPMAEILLKDDPKAPAAQRASIPRSQRELLETLVPRFADVINESGREALNDVQTTVPLKERQFRR
jgi:hypothetical protein